MECPTELELWTADEVAECISYPKQRDDGKVLYRKLYDILGSAKNPTPRGGDGSDGTVEEPADRLNTENDDKAPHWWSQLEEDEQAAIIEGAKNDGIIS